MFTHALLFKAICHKKKQRRLTIAKRKKMSWPSLCFYSVAKLYLTLCDPMNYSMGGVPVLHYLPEFVQIHVHGETVMPSNHLICCHPFSSYPQSFLSSGSFPVSWLFASGGQSFGASTSASVLPMNIQGWFPLGLTDLVSLLSQGLSRVFSSSTIRKHQFFSAQPSLWYKFWTMLH